MKSVTLSGMAVLRQPGAVIVRLFVGEAGPKMVRVECPAGVMPRLGSEVLFERLGGSYLLTGGG